MAFEKVIIHNRNVDARIKAFESNSNIDSKEKKDIKEFIRLLELGRINKGKKISKSRQLKYLDILRIPFIYFKKDTAKLTLQDSEKFDSDLSKDKILNKQNQKPLAQNTKVEIRKLFKIYLRWKLRKSPAKFQKLTDWWDTTYKSKTPDYLTEKEIIALFDGCKNVAERFLVCVLFDSGARIQEFLNLRLADITEPTKEFPYFMLDFKDEYAKKDGNGVGRGRKIGLYWARSEKAIKDYLNNLESTKKEDLLFSLKNSNATYDSIRFFLSRLARRTINRHIHPHLLRHSSSTFFANKMNRQELCIRYGWGFSSKMPDVYIARSGVGQKQIMETFKARGMDKFRLENEKLREQITNVHLEFQNKEKANEQMKKEINLMKTKFKKVVFLVKDSIQQIRDIKNKRNKI